MRTEVKSDDGRRKRGLSWLEMRSGIILVLGGDGWDEERVEGVAGGEGTYTRWRAVVIAWRVRRPPQTIHDAKPSGVSGGAKSGASGTDFQLT